VEHVVPEKSEELPVCHVPQHSYLSHQFLHAQSTCGDL